MKANGGFNASGKDRKRKLLNEHSDEQDRTKPPQSASRRHREKINATLEELGDLLPLPEEARSKLDKLTVLKLSVSFFQTQNYLQSGKRRKRRVDDAAVAQMTKKLAACHINVSDISLEALDSFFLVLSDSGDVFYTSENVFKYLGYTQTFLMHQNFLNFVHHEDVRGFERCLHRASKARILELEDGNGLDCEQFEEQPIPQVCFASIRCHAGRQSSHVSPFYYRSFKFDGKLKPLLSGKMKQYGFFALCTAVNPANPFTSTPKELLQVYSCKLGMDLRLKKLDNRGQKCLYMNEKDNLSRTGYFFVHPDDVQCMMLGHQRVTAEGHCDTVFRLMNGRGAWQWVRGKARIVYDKNEKPEFLATDNVLLNDEQGPFFQSVVLEILREWQSNQKGLPSPKSDEEKSSQTSSPDSALPPSLATNDGTSITTQGFAGSSEDVALQESKDIEIIEYSSPPVSTAEKEELLSPPLVHTPGTSESCMFSSANQSRSPVEEKPNILSREGMVFNSKPERRNGSTPHVHTKSKHSAHDQINLIKQFLMGVNSQPPARACHLETITRVDGGVIPDSQPPPAWSDYPGDPSSVLPELNFQQNDGLSAPYPPFPPQNGVNSSLFTNGYDHTPGRLPVQPNGLSCGGGTQQMDSTNLIYPSIPNIRDPTVNPSMSNPSVNGVDELDAFNLHVDAGIGDLHDILQDGPGNLSHYLQQEGTVFHSLKQRLNHGQNGLHHPQNEVLFPPVNQSFPASYPACDFLSNSSATGTPNQDPKLWFGASGTVPLNHGPPQVPQVPEAFNVDDLTPSLFQDPNVPFANQGNVPVCQPSQSMYSSDVSRTNGMHMSPRMAQKFQTPQNVQQRQSDSRNQSFNPGGNNSILKMMLTM